jgi:hypothetical protein
MESRLGRDLPHTRSERLLMGGVVEKSGLRNKNYLAHNSVQLT